MFQITEVNDKQDVIFIQY